MLRRFFGDSMRRIALTNAFCGLPTFFETQVLAIERQWALWIKSTTLFVPLRANKAALGVKGARSRYEAASSAARIFAANASRSASSA